MTGRVATFALTLALGALACSSTSTSSPSGAQGGDDAGGTGEGPGGEDASTGGATATDGSTSTQDGAATGASPEGSTDAGGHVPSGDGASLAADSGAGSPAGKTGVGGFCTDACNRAQTCASMVDGGSVNVTNCVINCDEMNESGPPNGTDLVLYRNDYVAALTSCVAAATCTETLNDTAVSACQSTLASSLTPSADVVALCDKLMMPKCSEDGDGGATQPPCLTQYAPFNDATILAITTCLDDPTCSNHVACVVQALTPG